MSSLRRFVKADLLERCAGSSSAARVAFAAACAEAMFSLVDAHRGLLPGPGDDALLRRALEASWNVARGDEVDDAVLEELSRRAESCVPDEDDERWVAASGLVQDAVASVAYAARAARSREPRECELAARQLYNAADYSVLRSRPELHDDEAAILADRRVQEALALVEAAIERAQALPSPASGGFAAAVDELRSWVRNRSVPISVLLALA